MIAIHGRTKDCSLEKRESWANAQYSWAVAGKNLRGKKFYFRRQFFGDGVKEERQSLALTDTSTSMSGPECVSSVT